MKREKDPWLCSHSSPFPGPITSFSTLTPAASFPSSPYSTNPSVPPKPPPASSSSASTTSTAPSQSVTPFLPGKRRKMSRAALRATSHVPSFVPSLSAARGSPPVFDPNRTAAWFLNSYVNSLKDKISPT